MADQPGPWDGWDARSTGGGSQHASRGRASGSSPWSTWRDRSNTHHNARNAAHNPQNSALPRYIERVNASCDDGDRSITVIDNRDMKIISPFQGWTVTEIVDNAAGTINIITERDQVMSPTSGYFFALHAVYTLQQWKLVINVSVEVTTSVPCARWDSDSATVFRDDARFRPFDWPMMYNFSPTFVDLKLHMGNRLLAHLTFRGLRSDRDMTIEKNYWDEFTVNEMTEGDAQISITLTLFQGWRITSVSGIIGNNLYALTVGGRVCALDKARWHAEIRRVKRNSDDAYGNDPDVVDLRFIDATARIDVRCGRTSTPLTWLVASHISGPALTQAIQSIRQAGGRIEGPQQVVHFGQLAEIHREWFTDSVADPNNPEDVRVVQMPTSDPANLHWMLSAKLDPRRAVEVRPSALAEGNHDTNDTHEFLALPPDVADRVGPVPMLMPDERGSELITPLGGQRSALQPFQTPIIQITEEPAPEDLINLNTDDQLVEVPRITGPASSSDQVPRRAQAKAAAPRLTAEDRERITAADAAKKGLIGRRRDAQQGTSGMTDPSAFIDMVNNAIPVGGQRTVLESVQDDLVEVVIEKVLTPDSSTFLPVRKSGPKRAPLNSEKLKQQLSWGLVKRDLTNMPTLDLSQEVNKLWYSFKTLDGIDHLVGLHRYEDPLRTDLLQFEAEDPETTALRGMKMAEVFAYRALLYDGEPELLGPVGFAGYKVKMKTKVKVGPGKASSSKGRHGILSPATCQNASRVFAKTKEKAQVKRAGVLQRMAQLTGYSVAEKEEDESSEEEEEAEEINTSPDDEKEDDRLPPSGHGLGVFVPHGSVVDVNNDGPRGEPKSLAPK